jgi:superfamily II RNA helicase
MDTKEDYKKYDKYANNDVNWQEVCLQAIENETNVILSSDTGSGKTRVFKQWALKKQERPIFITAPIKALSNQRYRELLDEGFNVGIETGDVKNVPENCDFICCTQEIYTNKYANIENATLIVDEFHYIFENSDRARTYIDALHNSKAKNILLCSATLGDIDKLQEYVNRVSGRDFMKYRNDSRLTSLHFVGDVSQDEIEDSLVVTFSRNNINYILQQLSSSRGEQDDEIVAKITGMAREDKIDNNDIIENAKKGLAGYYGGLLPKEKFFIEKCFEQGLIDTVVGTDALALGVNFPAQNVIFAQLAKYYEGPISKNLFDQLAGRAGRKGYFDEGFVYYCSEFSDQLEGWGYDTKGLFEYLLEAPNEDISIVLTPNIKDILLEKATIEQEAEFIHEFSTESMEKQEILEEISQITSYIKNDAFEQQVDRLVMDHFGFDYDDDDEYYEEDDEYEALDENIMNEKEEYRAQLLAKKEEFDKNIARVYFAEFTPHKNCQIFADILCGVEPDTILSKYANPAKFYDMLQFRKYVKSLPKKYRKGLTKINDEIREIDETAIEAYRGKVSVKEIGENLRFEGRLTANIIGEILNSQADFKNLPVEPNNSIENRLEEHS